jgi:hypothetical protein
VPRLHFQCQADSFRPASGLISSQPPSDGCGLRCDAEMPSVTRRCERCEQLILDGQRSKPAAQAKVKRPGDQRNSLCPPHAREEGVATEQLAKMAAVQQTYRHSAEGQAAQRTYNESAGGQARQRTYVQIIKRRTKAIMMDTMLGIDRWPQAVDYAVHTHNLVPYHGDTLDKA